MIIIPIKIDFLNAYSAHYFLTGVITMLKYSKYDNTFISRKKDFVAWCLQKMSPINASQMNQLIISKISGFIDQDIKKPIIYTFFEFKRMEYIKHFVQCHMKVQLAIPKPIINIIAEFVFFRLKPKIFEPNPNQSVDFGHKSLSDVIHQVRAQIYSQIHDNEFS